MPIEYRIATTADAPAIAAIYAPFVRDTAISFETQAPDAAEIARRIGHLGVQYPWIVATEAGRVIGYAYACEYRARLAYRWSVDSAVYLDASAHRRGIGRGLYARLFALLIEQGYVNVFGGITLPNPSSVGLHEAMGFTPIGIYRRVGYKCGRWPDVGWWQLVLCEPPNEPPDPRRFVDLDAAIVVRALEQPAPFRPDSAPISP